jgi:hypothetical protein
MPTKYFAATASDGQPVVRSSRSREYIAASITKRARERHWRSSWSSTRALAEKVRWYDLPGDVTEIVEAREVTHAEYLALKAEWERTVAK